MKKLDFIYFDAGGGHRAAANALRAVIERQNRPFEIRMVNLQELLDEIDWFRKITSLRLEDVYNLLLKKGWTLGSAQLTAGMHLVIRLFHSQQVKILERFWQTSQPDMVVSIVPNFNRALYDSLKRALPSVPMVTVLTDIADYPPHFWIERQEQYLICGSAKAVEQAIELGHSESRVFRASGMVLNPAFYELPAITDEERAFRRKALGFDPAKPVGIALFGGQGSAAMRDIARRLPGHQLLMICGHNARLRTELEAMPRRAPMHVLGFTKEVARYMQLADYLIGKPGPGSLSEAVLMGLPVIVRHNAWTLPQERYNAEWIRSNGIGIVLSSFKDIASAVEQMLAPDAHARFCEATRKMRNRAVFEIPDMFEEILRQSASAQAI